jgi:hypothetical protein
VEFTINTGLAKRYRENFSVQKKMQKVVYKMACLGTPLLVWKIKMYVVDGYHCVQAG